MSVVSIFLFWPLAIPAIINASKVDLPCSAGRLRRRRRPPGSRSGGLVIGLVGWAVGIVCRIVHVVLVIGSAADISV
jgi:hypothetical protein